MGQQPCSRRRAARRGEAACLGSLTGPDGCAAISFVPSSDQNTKGPCHGQTPSHGDHVGSPGGLGEILREAVELEGWRQAARRLYMTDGVFNVALLKKETEKEELGLYHFGMWVDNLDDA